MTICGILIYSGHYEQASQMLAEISAYMWENDNAFHAWVCHLEGLLAVTQSAYDEAIRICDDYRGLAIHLSAPFHFIIDGAGSNDVAFGTGFGSETAVD